MGQIDPTNRRVELKMVEIMEFNNGKMTGGRAYFDTGSMMTQLGLMPSMGAQAQRPAATPRH
jgi:predicted ester cyclase